MSDFDAIVVAGTTAEWTDPATDELPTRLNNPRHPARYYRISGPFPFTQTFKAQIAGVDTADAGLGGRLFSWGWHHYGNGPVPGFVTAPGNSYSAQVIFTARNTGLWIARCARPVSGAILLGVNVEL